MKQRSYLIADHKVIVRFTDKTNHYAALMPSFAPFAIDDAGESGAVLTVTFDNDRIPDRSTLTKVGKFPSVEMVYHLYLRGDGGLVISYGFKETFAIGIIDFSSGLNQANIVLFPKGADLGYAISNALMIAYTVATSGRQTLVIHSSTVNYNGFGYMFLGKSGTGKSTHSALWIKNIPSVELMNDDNPIIRICNNEQAVVYGSPWSGKTPCYRQVSAPVGALVSLHQAKENKIRPLSPVEALVELFTSVSMLMCHRPCYDKIMSTVIRLAEITPFYSLDCLPDDEAAKICSQAICRRIQ